jgi:hypothetical protein
MLPKLSDRHLGRKIIAHVLKVRVFDIGGLFVKGAFMAQVNGKPYCEIVG